MRILIDTNVLISAILFPNPRMNHRMDINPEDYPEIRDKNDLPILVSAIVAGADVIITGDKDFFDMKARDFEMELPVIITPREFIEGIK